MRIIFNALALLAVAVSPSLALGQAFASDEPAANANFQKLPEPLDKITVNTFAFEESKHFEVANVRVEKRGSDSHDSIIWTLRATNSMTFRHVESFLRDFRHAHFFSRVKNPGHPAYSTLLYYSPAVAIDAANGEVLPRGGSIDVWITLSQIDVLRIQGAKADNLVFGRYTRR